MLSAASFTRLFHLLADRLPTRTPMGVARRLISRANAARDASRHGLAASLYEEALRFAPANLRIHIQCGHMLKEAGDLVGAEHHYGEAKRLAPGDPDLALQLGHFYKVVGRFEEAEESYRLATELKPGWREPAEELARIRSSFAIGELAGIAPGTDLSQLAPELLPSGLEPAELRRRDGIRVWRIGAARIRSREGFQPVLRGVEALRGCCISSIPLHELQILLDGKIIHREPLRSASSESRGKHVFNIWYDFSRFEPGPCELELRFLDKLGLSRTRKRKVLVATPVSESSYPASDALVTVSADDPSSVEDQVNARESVVRSVARSPLQPPRSILVQRAEQLGDLVCAVPALLRLRELYPEARIVGLVSPANAAFARTLEMLDDVVIADFNEDERERRRTMSLRAQEELRRTLQAYAFDLAIDLSESSGTRALLLLSGAPFLYGFKDREAPWLSAGFEINGHDPINRLEVAAQSRKLVALVEGLAALTTSRARIVRRTGLRRSALAAYGIGPDERYVVLHTGARLPYSRWPHFGELTQLLLARTDLKVILFASADDDQLRPLPAARVTTIFGQLPFDDFDALLSFCSAFVGNDSGPKHLAALRGAKVVSVHMARLNWNEWGQEISGSIISRRVPCAGCAISDEREDCGKGFACLHRISPLEVYQAITALL